MMTENKTTPLSAMSPQIRQGKLIVLGVIAANLLVSFFVTAAAVTSAESLPTGDRGGRFVLTAILFWFLYIGHRWAKWVTVFLLTLSGMVGVAIGVLFTGIPLIQLASAAILVFPRATRAFLGFQRGRRILTHAPIVRVVSAALGCLLIVTIACLGFLAYFVESSDPGDVIRDGLGRPLSLSPVWMRLFLGTERLWTGWRWFAADSVLFLCGMALGLRMVNGDWEWSRE